MDPADSPLPPADVDDGPTSLRRLGQQLHTAAEALRRRGLWLLFGTIGGVIGGVVVAGNIKAPVSNYRFYKATTTLSLEQPGAGHNGIEPVDWSMQLAQLALLSQSYQKDIAKEIGVSGGMVANHVQGIPSASSMSFQVTAITTNAPLASKLSFAVAQGLNDEIEQVGNHIAAAQYLGATYELAVTKARQQKLLASLDDEDPNAIADAPEVEAVQNHYANLFSYVSTFNLKPKPARFAIIGAPHAIEITSSAYYRRWITSTVDFGGAENFGESNSVQTAPPNTANTHKLLYTRKPESDVPVDTTPPPIQPIGLGGLAGLVMGGAAIMLGEAWDDRFHDTGGAVASSGLRPLAEIPHLSKRSVRGLVSTNPTAPVRQALTRYRAAAAMVAVDLGMKPTRSAHALASPDEPVTERRAPVVLVTSANPAEGKSTSSAALARGFADLGLDVLAVNGDFHRSSLRKILRPVPDLVHPRRPASTVIDRTWFLDTRRNAKTSMPLLVAELTAIIERWRDQFDVIVLDTPPILATGDATEFLIHADSVVLVGRADQTSTTSLERASNLLRRYKIATPGLIVTDIPRSVVDRAYGPTNSHR
jgi:Mrp family chromosome partitioning ATPase